jgi:5-methylthioadenosine/S-adenosylhomocysteine deaminase
VYAADGSDVRHSIINGRLVMEDRQMLTLNLKNILTHANTKASLVKQWISDV